VPSRFCAGVCALYEKELKRLNPTVQNITYDVSELYVFLDQMTDVSALVCVCRPQPRPRATASAWSGACSAPTQRHAASRPAPRRRPPRARALAAALDRPGPTSRSFHEPISAYVARDKEWVKKHVFTHLKGQAHM